MSQRPPVNDLWRSPWWAIASLAILSLSAAFALTAYLLRPSSDASLTAPSLPPPTPAVAPTRAEPTPPTAPLAAPKPPDPAAGLSPEVAAGRCLMIGIPAGWSPQSPYPLNKVAAGSVILYKQNIPSSKEALRRLCDNLRAYGQQQWGHKPIVAIDHEGGSINRMPKLTTYFAPNWELGQPGNAGALVAHEGQVMGAELHELGIDLDLAPVVDVLEHPAETHIGVRSYGSDPELVGTLAADFIGAMRQAGTATCAKHWPGYGRLGKDPHKYIAQGNISHEEWLAKYVPPFQRAVAARVDSVMSGHIIYSFFDPDKPGSVVPAVYRELRARTGFEGPILTDDMEMKSAIDFYHGDFGRLALEAKKAGADLVLVCWTAQFAIDSQKAIAGAISRGELDVSESLRLIEQLRRF
jgi:beta-N-acetylhexosaminidase